MKVRGVMFFGMMLAASTVFAAGTTELKTPKDKVSYAIGMDMASSLKRNAIEVDPDILGQALKSVLTGQKTILTDDEVKTTLTELQKEMQAKQQEKTKAEGEKNKKEGEAFLADNKKKDGVKTLPSGLQYKVMTEGKGKSPKATDTVSVQYRGTLIDGTEFDSSYKRGTPYPVNLKGGVIACWLNVLKILKAGTKAKIVCPSDVAYSDKGRPGIKGGETLLFDIEFVEIAKPAAPAADKPVKK